MSSNTEALIGTGLGFGVVHVLTGPDHLGALATLSSGADGCASFSLGVRWGIGHSTGLLLVGCVLIARDLSESDDHATTTIDMPVSWSHLFEYIVGVVMICLGTHGFFRAFHLRSTGKLGSHPPTVVAPNWYCATTMGIEDEEEASLRDDPTERDPIKCHLEVSVHSHSYHSFVEHDTDTESQDILSEEGSGTSASRDRFGMMDPKRSPSQRLSTQVLALFAGVVHGLAGPGGVLGVIPAVQLHDWKLAAVYLASFCISSTVTMGCFACLYGCCSSNIGKRSHVEFHIHCFSSAVSIMVGVTWLTLLTMGKLEDVFP